MVNDENWLGIYSAEPIKKKNWKIIVITLCICITLGLILVTVYSVGAIADYSEYKKYEKYLVATKKQEEQKKKEEKDLKIKQAEQEKAKREAEEERKRQEKIPKLTEVGKQNMANIYRSEEKRVFLTFDDGPSSITPTILDILKQEGIKATFFVLGSNAEARPETLKRIYEEGHFIANHGYTHKYSAIYASPEEVLKEYNQCNDVVKNAIGVPEYNSHLFRFPGGLAGGKYAEVKKQAKELLNQNNILNIDWNALNGDGETNKLSPEFEMKRLDETVQERNSIVLLMHDAQAKKVTAETLPQIISYFKERGYEFKSFYDIIK